MFREEGVYVLTQENFDDFLANNEYVMVEFYAPWCVSCDHFAPEYHRAAKILANEGSPIVLAKVDCVVETSLAKKHGIKCLNALERDPSADSYPTLIFFKRDPTSKLPIAVKYPKRYPLGYSAIGILKDFIPRNTNFIPRDAPDIEIPQGKKGTVLK